MSVRIFQVRLRRILAVFAAIILALLVLKSGRSVRRFSDQDLLDAISGISRSSWSNLVLEANNILQEKILSLDASVPFISIDSKPPTINLIGSEAWIKVVGEDAPYIVIERTYKDRLVSIYVKPGGKAEIKEPSQPGDRPVPVRPQVRVSREVVVAEQARRK